MKNLDGEMREEKKKKIALSNEGCEIKGVTRMRENEYAQHNCPPGTILYIYIYTLCIYVYVLYYTDHLLCDLLA